MDHSITSWIKKVLITLLIGLWVYLIYEIRSIIFLILISGFITIITHPLISLAERYKIPAWVSIIGIFIVVFLLGSIVIGTLIPIIVNYISESIGAITLWASTAKEVYMSKGIGWFGLHPYVERVIIFLFWERNIDHTLDIIKQNAGNIQAFLTGQISSLTSGGLMIVSQVGGAIASWVLILISTFLMVIERRAIGRYILTSTPIDLRHYVENHYAQIQHLFTAWIRGMLILSLSIFLITYIGLIAIQAIFDFSLEKTFTLALIGGITEFIPYVWPLIALIPAVIIGLGISWEAALIITILYIVIQQIENNVLVPYVMSRSLDLSPFFVFIVMLIGASLGWVLGIILAIPVAWVLRIIFEEYKKRWHSDTTGKVEKNLTTKKKVIS